MHRMTCPCGRIFTAERSTAKYCCELHRVQAHRGHSFTIPPPWPGWQAWVTKDGHRLWFGAAKISTGEPWDVRMPWDHDLSGFITLRLPERAVHYEPDGRRWVSIQYADDVLDAFAMERFNVTDLGRGPLPPLWLCRLRGDPSPVAQALGNLLTALPIGQWRRVAKAVSAAAHPDRGGKRPPAADELLLLTNRVLDEL